MGVTFHPSSGWGPYRLNLYAVSLINRIPHTGTKGLWWSAYHVCSTYLGPVEVFRRVHLDVLGGRTIRSIYVGAQDC